MLGAVNRIADHRPQRLALDQFLPVRMDFSGKQCRIRPERVGKVVSIALEIRTPDSGPEQGHSFVGCAELYRLIGEQDNKAIKISSERMSAIALLASSAVYWLENFSSSAAGLRPFGTLAALNTASKRSASEIKPVASASTTIACNLVHVRSSIAQPAADAWERMRSPGTPIPSIGRSSRNWLRRSAATRSSKA